MERRYANEVVGYNARMTDVHAAIGRVQLRRLPGWTALRRANAELLTEGLAELERLGAVTLPAVAPSAAPVWHQYTVRVPRRDDVVAAMAAAGVQTAVYYPTPIHRLPAYDLDIDLPVTTAAAREVVSLPVHPALSAADLDLVVSAMTRILTGEDVR
jgi:perosamine synthetase